MNIGALVSFLIIVVFLIVGFLVWRGRDNGPLGRAERDAKLVEFVQSGTEQDLEWRLFQLQLSTRDLPRGKPSLIDNWVADCRACLLLEMKLGIEPGKSLAEKLDSAKRDLAFDSQTPQGVVREAIGGLQRGQDILELLQLELKSNP
jgi:hypothetical protein